MIYEPIPPCCSKCGQILPATLEYFYFDKRRQRLYRHCKRCHNKLTQNRYKTAIANPAKDGQEKRCNSCGKTYLATPQFFHTHKAGRHGLRSKCKACYAKAVGRWQKQNRRKVNAATQRYHKRYPQKTQVWQKKSYRKYYQSEKGQHCYRRCNDNRRSRKRHAEGCHTPGDIKRQYIKQAGRCFWCSQPVGDSYHVDHIIPLSRFGTDWLSNIVIACPFCNDSKGVKLPFEEWTPPRCLGR